MALLKLLANIGNFRYYAGKGYSGNGGEPGLKSIPYGNDRIGGGDSGEPYVTTNIPKGIGYGQEEASTQALLSTDFLLRGGITAATATADDLKRIGKFMTSPKGLIFTAKQNLLTRLGVKTQAGGQEVYLPTSTLAQIGVEATGLHFYKQGVNPVPVPGNPPIISLGPLGNLSLTGNIISYSQVVPVGDKNIPSNLTNLNRLYQLFDVKVLNNANIYSGNSISSSPTEIIKYSSGPGSILGIGPTSINFADQRVNTYNYLDIKKYNYLTLGYKGLSLANTATQVGNINGITTVSTSRRSVENFRDTPAYVPKIIDFRDSLRQIIRDRGGNTTTLMSNSPSYNLGDGQTIETRVNLGDPGNKTGKNLISYTNGSGIGPVDKINENSLYESRLVDPNFTNDLVKFRIEAIDNEDPGKSVFIHFRAFLDAFSDTYSANWTPTRYVGRGEEFFTYGGFTRGISINWTVAAQSKEELIPMYQKLNYLASNLTPDYSEAGYMRGPLMRLTVGGYLYSQPGFITNLTYTVDDQSPWEIGINDGVRGSLNINTTSSVTSISDPSVKELAHIIRVSMNYTPIHTFIPRKQTNVYKGIPAGQGTGNRISGFGPEHYIALSTGDHNNYKNSPNYTSPELKTNFGPPAPDPNETFEPIP